MRMFETKVRRVGNSHSVIIPAPILNALDIAPGSVLSVSLDADGILLRRAGTRASRAEFIEMLDRLGAKNAGILRGLAK